MRRTRLFEPMTLQARLTFWSMLVMASIVTIVSVLDLVGEVNRELDDSQVRGKLILDFASSVITDDVERSRYADITEAISKSTNLPVQLLNLSLLTHSLVDEIAITDGNGRLLADSLPRMPGSLFGQYPSFAGVVNGSLVDKWKLLYQSRKPYEIAQMQVDQRKARTITIRVLLSPALIRASVRPILTNHAWTAILSVVGAVLGAFVFATIAFHPLGKLGKMLDMVASGEYELQQVSSNEDEFSMVASKVNMLGQELKGARSEFSDLKGNFERVLDELEDAVLIFGRDRRLVAAAGAVESLLSRSRPELVGLPVNEIFPLGTSPGLLLAQAMQLGRPIHNRAIPMAREKNGTSQLKIMLLSVEFLGDQSGMLIRLRDPEATRQIGRQLQTADRLSAISRLTSGVAHEVKNPLNAILMHVELAKIKLAHGDYDVNPHMEVLTSEILRLDRVVKTFLDFTRPVQLNLIDVPLAEFVEELAELARPQAAASNIAVQVDLAAEPVFITIDPDLFKQAVLNIVVNAIEAMTDGGTLHFWSGVRGDHAEIRISDTGSGIPSEVRDKIYNLYFTTKQKGSGIGLSMTFRIVQLHDGTIDFESEAGRGTTFSLTLPTAVSHAGPHEPA